MTTTREGAEALVGQRVRVNWTLYRLTSKPVFWLGNRLGWGRLMFRPVRYSKCGVLTGIVHEDFFRGIPGVVSLDGEWCCPFDDTVSIKPTRPYDPDGKDSSP